MDDLPPAPGEFGTPFAEPSSVEAPPFDAEDLRGALYRLQNPTQPPVATPPLEGDVIPGPGSDPVTIFEDPFDFPGDFYPSYRPAIAGEAIEVGATTVFGDIFGALARAAGEVLGGPVAVAVGSIIEPGELGSGELPVAPIPPVVIPEPGPITLPEPTSPATPDLPTPDFPAPEPPDVVVVTPTAPNPSTSAAAPPNPNLSPWQFDAPRIVLPRLHPRRTRWPLPTPTGAASVVPFTPPTPATPPVPSTLSPPLPLPAFPAVPLPIATPLPLPLPLPLPTPMPADLTPQGPAAVESPPGESCETPQERKDRQKRQRENCGKKLARIKVKAHYRKVCLREAVVHEARRYKKKLVRKYITKPAGDYARAGTDWLLREIGLTPYVDQAKDVKKRVSGLTKRQKRLKIEIPGTHVDINPQDFLPKPLGGKL